MTTDRLEELVRSYFRLSDARDPRSGDLFAEDVEFYFPRFGVGKGKAQLAAFATGFRSQVQQIRHPQDKLRFIVAGSRIVVEGTTEGHTSAGHWRGGETPGGRFCSVFDVHDDRIVRMYIYIDPDYTASSDLGFGWTEDQHSHW